MIFQAPPDFLAPFPLQTGPHPCLLGEVLKNGQKLFGWTVAFSVETWNNAPGTSPAHSATRSGGKNKIKILQLDKIPQISNFIPEITRGLWGTAFLKPEKIRIFKGEGRGGVRGKIKINLRVYNKSKKWSTCEKGSKFPNFLRTPQCFTLVTPTKLIRFLIALLDFLLYFTSLEHFLIL